MEKLDKVMEQSRESLTRELRAIEKEMAELDAQMTALMAEDRTDYVNGIIKKLFSEFSKAHAWTVQQEKNVRKLYQVWSPIGRVRHLYGALMGNYTVSKQVRRGSNAPVQGFASEIGIKTAYRILRVWHEHRERMLPDEKQPVLFARAVHDALYFYVPYSAIIPFLHIVQYEATYGITAGYKDDFGVQFAIEPEIEMEISANDAKSYKFDWSLPDAVANIKKAATDAYTAGLVPDGKLPHDVIDIILKPWRVERFRHYLQKHWPLLGVTNLDKQIDGAINDTEGNTDDGTPAKVLRGAHSR